MNASIKLLYTNEFSQEQIDLLMKLPGWVIVARAKGGNQYHSGICENSFSMSLEPGKAVFWWVGKARSNLGTTHELGAARVKKSATHHMTEFSKSYPDLEFELIDVRAEDCPIEFNWSRWLWGSQPTNQKLSGVVDKYAARNLEFWMRGDDK